MIPANTSRMPAVLDIQPTGSCPWACPGCWGADHKKAGSLSPKQWLKILRECRDRGTQAIVVTGGEPLVYTGIEELIVGAKALGLRVTLSTVGVGLLEKPAILDNIDDLGIPWDGATPATHRAMRPASHRFLVDAFDTSSDYLAVVEILQHVPKQRPQIDLTLRTVVGLRNRGGVTSIPATLRGFPGVALGTVRWKVYELNPYLALVPRPAAQRLRLPQAEFEQLARRVVEEGTEHGFRTVEVQRVQASGSRYFFIDPNGDCFAVRENNAGDIEQVDVGSAHDLDAVANRLQTELPDFVERAAHRLDDVRPLVNLTRYSESGV